MLKNGGYIMIDLSSNDVYNQANGCLTFKGDKAIMVIDDNEVYFADTINKSGDNVIITKGGKTITIGKTGSVSTSGTINTNIYEHNLYCLNEGDSTDDIIILKLLNNSATEIDDLTEVLTTDVDYQVTGIVTNGDHSGNAYAIHKSVTEDVASIIVDYVYYDTTSDKMITDEYTATLVVTDTITKLV